MKKILCIFAVLILLAFVETAIASTSDSIAWLQSQQTLDTGLIQNSGRVTDWGVIAISAGGVNPALIGKPSLLDAIKSYPLTNSLSTDIERRILALRAAGQPALSESNQLTAAMTGGQFGSVDLLNDDYFGILALESVNTSNSAIARSVTFVQNHQNGDGGFSSFVGGASDVDSTGAAITALSSAGGTASTIDRGFAYLSNNQNSDGGFGVKAGQASNVASTSWALWAYHTAGRVNLSAEAWLRAQQLSNGSFGGAVDTAYAVIALSGKVLPIVGSFASTPAPISSSISTNATPTSLTSTSSSSSSSSTGNSASASASASATNGASSSSSSSKSIATSSLDVPIVSEPNQIAKDQSSLANSTSTDQPVAHSTQMQPSATAIDEPTLVSPIASIPVPAISENYQLVRNLILGLVVIGGLDLIIILTAIGQWFAARDFFRQD